MSGSSSSSITLQGAVVSWARSGVASARSRVGGVRMLQWGGEGEDTVTLSSAGLLGEDPLSSSSSVV